MLLKKGKSEALSYAVSFNLLSSHSSPHCPYVHARTRTHMRAPWIITTLVTITGKVGCPLYLEIIFVHSRLSLLVVLLRIRMTNEQIILYSVTCSCPVCPWEAPKWAIKYFRLSRLNIKPKESFSREQISEGE